MLGQTVSHYEILGLLGEGGMGVVYKARDPRLDRLVALKFLSARLLEDPAARTRLFQEARTISALSHPNIETIHDVGEWEGRPFLVLEFLPGGPLSARLLGLKAAGQLLPIDEAVAYGLDIAAALAAAHSAGIVHRDVKSSNALFSARGELKLTDFGLAKFRGSAAVTRTGGAPGTLLYMSPEQVEGREIDGRSDIFSYGVLLYEAVSGATPFAGDSEANIIHRILTADPKPLREVRQDAPAGLERIVGKALEKDRERRYDSMDQLLADLDAVGAELGRPARRAALPPTVTAVPSPVGTRTSRVSRALRWGMAALVLLALLLFTPGLLKPRVPAEKQLVVLPFAAIGGDATQQALCEGLMETLTSALTQLEQFHGSLWVVPASEVRNQRIQSAQEARRAFGVNLALTGSFQRQGGRARLIANLVDAARLRQLRSLDFELDDFSALQDDAVRRVAQMLELELKPKAQALLAQGRTQVPRAYDYYLQGNGYLRRYGRPEDTEQAIRLFEQALAQDPKYALAHAGLAEAYWRRYSQTREREWVNRSREAAGRAVSLNPSLAQSHTVTGLIERNTGGYDAAIRAYRRALELDPTNADAQGGLAACYEAVHKLTEAEAVLKKAAELHRDYWLAHSRLGLFYLRHARYQEAIPVFQRVIELTPDNYSGFTNLAGAYHYLGRFAEAEDTYRKSLAIRETAAAYTSLGTVYFYQGRYRDAVPVMEKAAALGPKRSRNWGNLADAYRWTPELAHKAPEAYRRAAELARNELAVNRKDAQLLSSLGLYEANLGDRKEAQANIAAALRLAPDNTNVLYNAALTYELIGQRLEALRQLERAIRRGYSAAEVLRDPVLEALRKDSNFRRILAYSQGTSKP